MQEQYASKLESEGSPLPRVCRTLGGDEDFSDESLFVILQHKVEKMIFSGTVQPEGKEKKVLI